MEKNTSEFSNTELLPFLECEDYTVSRETFSLLKDVSLEMLITLPKPKTENLDKYYESEDYISHTDSKKSLGDKMYQIAKNYAIKQKVKLINSFCNKPNMKDQRSKIVLDIGCGTGDFLVACKNKNFNVVGVEPNKNARVKSKSKLGVLVSKLETFNDSPKVYKSINKIENQKFDVITMWHVLEHVPNLQEYVLQLKQLLNENGTLIIAVPNYKSYDAKYYNKFWAAYDVPRHLWHFSKKTIKILFNKEGLELIKILPMKLDAFYVSLLSEKYKTGKSNYLKAFYIGLKSNFKANRTKEYSSLIYILKKK